MRRGFKTFCEKNAEAARRALRINRLAPLDPWKYASHLGVAVVDFAKFELSDQSRSQLTIFDGDSWSAMALKDGSSLMIVLNPSHAPTRQKNDLMHELAHIELKHVPARVDVSPTGLFLLSDFSDEQEQEADWHAGALLLPRNALMHFRSQGKSVPELAKYFGVSAALCEWRLRMTGIEVQLRRMGA